MANSPLTIKINNQSFKNWSDVSITISMLNLAHSFSFTAIYDLKNNEFTNHLKTFKTGKEVKIYIKDKLVSTGYIDNLSTSLTTNGISLNISGRSKTADLIDCSTSIQLKNLTLTQIIKKLCSPFKINVKELAKTKAVDDFHMQCENIFQSINTVAKSQGLLLITDSNGDLLITKPSNQKGNHIFKQGHNIMEAHLSYDQTKTFSKYTIKTHDGDKQTYEDKLIKRYRPYSVVADDQTHQTAKTTANRNHGLANSLSILTAYWFMNNRVWNVNQKIKLDIPMLDLNTSWLTVETRFSYNQSQGETCELTLQPMKAYG